MVPFLAVAAAASLSCSQPLPSAPSAPAKAAPVLVLNELGKGAADLDGPWQFHLGDDPAWAAPGFDDSGWEQLTADESWGAQGHPSYVGFGWYRRHIALTPADGAAPDFLLLLNGVDDAYDLYWNGQPIGHNGKLPPAPVWYPFQPAQTYGLGPIRAGVLAVRVWKAPLGSNDPDTLGGFEAVPVLGSPKAIAASKATLDYRWLRSRQIQFGMTALYALAAVLSFLMWLRDRSQSLLFWMAAYSITPMMASVLQSFRIPWPSQLAQGLTQPVLALQDVALWYVLLWLLNLQDDRAMARATRAVSILIAIAFTLDGLVAGFWGVLPPHPMQLADAALTAIFTPIEAFPIVLLAAAIMKKSRPDSASWLVAVCAGLTEMIYVTSTAAEQGIRYTHWTLTARMHVPLFTLAGNPVNARLLSRLLLLLAMGNAVIRYSIEDRRRQRAIEQELKNARELQQVLVPQALPSLPGYAVTSAYRPAQEVGGDFFQIIPLEDGVTLIVLGDVSGKGLRAAMAVALIVGAVRMVAEFTTSPAEVLAGLNRRLYGRLQGGFTTCIAMRLDAAGNCTLASAGHPPPFLNHRELAVPGAFPLGIQPDTGYEETTLRLDVGDHFALYTDGLLEARDPSGELFSFERLQTLFATHPSADQATEAAVNFGQDDDITVLTLTRLATGEESTALHTAPMLAGA